MEIDGYCFEQGVAHSVDMTSLSFVLMVKYSEERGAAIFQTEKDVMLALNKICECLTVRYCLHTASVFPSVVFLYLQFEIVYILNHLRLLLNKQQFF